MSDKCWHIQLGDDHWARFTYARPQGSAFRLLGSVARNAQVGALAETAEGQYLQVNGDHVMPLSGGQLRRAVAAARRAAPRPSVRRESVATPPVVVTFKRRRVLLKEPHPAVETQVAR
jgi:hypothetical protein